MEVNTEISYSAEAVAILVLEDLAKKGITTTMDGVRFVCTSHRRIGPRDDPRDGGTEVLALVKATVQAVLPSPVGK